MTEEALIGSAEYPGVEDHIISRNEFKNRMRLLTGYRVLEEEVQGLLVFLKNWRLKHINRNDQGYAAFVRSHLGL